MKFKAVVFDLDGTLLDTIDDLADSMNAVLAANALPTHGVDQYKYFVGDGVETLVERVLPENARDPETIRTLVTQMKRHYGQHWADKTRPYEGIPELLAELERRGLPIAVLSNKPDEATQGVVARFFPAVRFAWVQGALSSVPKKPHPAGAIAIAQRLGLAPADILYVGDTNTDMQTGNAAGMCTVGVLWGFRTAEELIANQAKTLIAAPAELLNLLQ